jgi:hypothetical protein
MNHIARRPRSQGRSPHRGNEGIVGHGNTVSRDRTV